MRKFWSLFVVSGALAAAFVFAGSAQAADAKEKKEPVKAEEAGEKEPPEFIEFDKAKLGTVKFPHKAHAEMLGSCDACHGGKAPLFVQAKSEEVLKMADMYAGKTCGQCHDGKKKQGEKVIFATKGACMKCHKKAAAKAK